MSGSSCCGLIFPDIGCDADYHLRYHSMEAARSHAPFQHRNYESRILRESEPVPAPTRTATLLEDRRGATGPKLPQGRNAYISHERWKRTAPSVLPADGCAMSPLAGQLQQLHNSSGITDPYHLISKPDTTIEAGMFSAISSSSPAYAGKSYPPTPPPCTTNLLTVWATTPSIIQAPPMLTSTWGWHPRAANIRITVLLSHVPPP